MEGDPNTPFKGSSKICMLKKKNFLFDENFYKFCENEIDKF